MLGRRGEGGGDGEGQGERERGRETGASSTHSGCERGGGGPTLGYVGGCDQEEGENEWLAGTTGRRGKKH